MSQPNFPTPSLSQVYQTAIDFRDTKPWILLNDSDIFAVQSPVSGKIGYCCIMGNAKMTYALGIYDGLAGLNSFLKLRSSADSTHIDQMEAALGQEMYKVGFEDRELIREEDKKIYKKLGLTFRGKNQWIQIEKWLPGYFPETVVDQDLDLIFYALEQSLVVFEKFKINPSVVRRNDNKILLRVPESVKGELTWEDKYIEVPSDWESEPVRVVSEKVIKKAEKDLPYKKGAACFLLQYISNPISGSPEETKPFFPKLVIWASYGTAEIIGFKLYSPKTFELEFEEQVLEQFYEFGFIPTQILINSEMAGQALDPLLRTLKTEVIFAPDQDVFEVLEREFIQMISNGPMF